MTPHSAAPVSSQPKPPNPDPRPVPSSAPPSNPSAVSGIAQKIPGLRFPLPFYMFRPWVKLGHPIRLFEYLLKTYGRIAHYRFMGTPIVFLNDPSYIQQVIGTYAEHFVK